MSFKRKQIEHQDNFEIPGNMWHSRFHILMDVKNCLILANFRKGTKHVYTISYNIVEFLTK